MTTLRLMNLAQMVVQGRYNTQSSLLTLPHINPEHIPGLVKQKLECLPQLFGYETPKLKTMLGKVGLNKQQVSKALNVVDNLPQIDVKWSLESKSVEADGTGTVTI